MSKDIVICADGKRYKKYVPTMVEYKTHIDKYGNTTKEPFVKDVDILNYDKLVTIEGEIWEEIS